MLTATNDKARVHPASPNRNVTVRDGTMAHVTLHRCVSQVAYARHAPSHEWAWRVEDKDYSNAAARRPFISCMLHRVSLLLAQSGHSTVEFRCPLLGVKQTLRGRTPMSASDPKRTFGPEDCCHAK